MEKRINFILNGKRDISTVMNNLHKLFESQDKILFYTKSEKTEFIDAIKNNLHLDDKGVEAEVSYNKFNEIDYNDIKNNGSKKIIGIKMPNSLFHNISKAYNDAFKFVDNTEIAEYMHCFADDCEIIGDSNYDPSMYEWFMDIFEEPFVMDSKLNPGNYAFKKYSPRFVFISQSKLRNPVSFVHYESKDHFIINRSKIKEMFDDKLHRMYVTEFLMRLNKMGVIKHPTFYPDPVIETWVKRCDKFIVRDDINTLTKEYIEDDTYLKETLKYTLNIENSVDPIVKELSDFIESKLNNKSSDDKKDADE